MMLYAKRIRRAGFTLIEIMIVIAIIAILAGIAIPNISRARKEAKLEACLTNSETICKAMSMAGTRKSLNEVFTAMRKFGSPSGGNIDYWYNRWFDAMNYDACQEWLVEYGYLNNILRCPYYQAGKSVWTYRLVYFYNKDDDWWGPLYDIQTGRQLCSDSVGMLMCMCEDGGDLCFYCGYAMGVGRCSFT